MVEQRVNTGAAKISIRSHLAYTVKHYREVFAPRMLRASTFSIADGTPREHLEADWNDVPVEHINIGHGE